MTTHHAGARRRQPGSTPPPDDSSPIVELRQYTLHPGQRDVLIDVFDRELVEPQQDLGMRVIGQFRDLDDPDRFVWLRGFADMDARLAGLTAFYGGPVWAKHKAAANATMIDSDDVLLLRPASPETGLPAASAARPDLGASDIPPTLIGITVFSLARPVDEELLRFFNDDVEPLLSSAGAPPLALLQTEPARNNFPALPVREAEHTVVRLTRFASLAEHTAHQQRLQQCRAWVVEVQPHLEARLTGSPRHLRLQPTARSLLS